MKSRDALPVIGRAESVDFPDLGFRRVPAKVDTGADSSAVWVSSLQEKPDGLHCIFFGTGSTYFTGQVVVFPKKAFKFTTVLNSFGQKERRYKLKLRIRVKGRLVWASFTLSDRSRNTYPILIGRKLLLRKFVVDVGQGTPLAKSRERRRSTTQNA